MWLKLVGSTMVIGAGTAIGFGLARSCSERPRQISQLMHCLVALKSFIGYVSMPLPEAFHRCSAGVEGPIGDFLRRAAEILETNSQVTPGEAIEEALKQEDSKLYFHSAELDVLQALGANLGILHHGEQENYLSLVQEQLENIRRGAESVRDKNCKLYRYLGLCSGLLIVLVMI
jgi:stage III sporulation protein AB